MSFPHTVYDHAVPVAGVVDVLPSAPPAAPKRRALTTRFLDFWLLGGASILVWFAMFVLQYGRSHWAVDQHFKNLAITSVSLTLLVNNPHFLVSYKLAYSRGRSFIREYMWQLVWVPLLLVGMFALAFVKFDARTTDVLPFLPAVAAGIQTTGLSANVFSAPRLGDFLFTLAFNAMFFTVGWHYTKQAFGCMMVYASFDGYKLSPYQRNLLRYNLLSIWWLNFAAANTRAGQLTFSDFKYYSLDLPDVLVPIAASILITGFAFVVVKVFYRNYVANRQVPGLTMLAPFVAMYVWWVPLMRQAEFYMLLTPLFHSLQYLAVVYKMEDERLKGARHFEIRATALMLGLVLAGWLSFEFIPHSMDNVFETFNTWKMFFFFTAAMLFINIHHYFIDNVLWRFKDPVVKKYLLA